VSYRDGRRELVVYAQRDPDECCASVQLDEADARWATIGAFLVGTALSDPVAEHTPQLMRPLRDAFAATFFVFFGLQLDASVLRSAIGAAAAPWAVGAALNVATGWGAARRAGIGLRGAARAGTALIARGEFSILLARLGVGAGLEPQRGPLATTYVLLCAISGPLLARSSDAIVDALGAWRPVAGRILEIERAPAAPVVDVDDLDAACIQALAPSLVLAGSGLQACTTRAARPWSAIGPDRCASRWRSNTSSTPLPTRNATPSSQLATRCSPSNSP
jgi:hypothetical protein